jgi:hypothetical protein
MRILSTVFGVFLFVFLTPAASAQLTPFTDYTVSDEIDLVTTVRVHANMDDDYLEGLRDTWIASNRVAKELGQIKDFAIYRSDLPQSGDFNLVLVVTLSGSADMAPSKERYDAFMKKWGEKRNEQSRAIAKNYPSMRVITGSYIMRRVDVK